MIRRISSYKISILKDDIKYLPDDSYALLVHTTDLLTAQKLEELVNQLNKIGWIYDGLVVSDREKTLKDNMTRSEHMIQDETCRTNLVL